MVIGPQHSYCTLSTYMCVKSYGCDGELNVIQFSPNCYAYPCYLFIVVSNTVLNEYALNQSLPCVQ